MANEKKIWDYLLREIRNEYGVAGLMGNLYAESALISNNAQNSGNNRLGMTDDEYTAAVDNGTYTNFIHDAIGYGLAQWTYWSRKRNMLEYAKSAGVSIGDLDMQLGFLVKELRAYSGVWNTLCNAKSVREASDAVLLGYERPADQSESACVRRAGYGQKYYDEYASAYAEDDEPQTDYVIYEVQSGDTLSKIARKYGTTVDAIVEANGIVNKNLIYAGDALRIPTEQKEESKPEYTKYKVKRGDNLTKIAKAHNTTVAELVALNNIKNANIIYVGQILTVPAK